MSTATTFITLFIVLISTHSIDLKAFLNPKLLYVTPGLWVKSGAVFWEAFLFETPFAWVRGFIWMVIPIMIAIGFIIGSKANKLYKQTQEDPYSN